MQTITKDNMGNPLNYRDGITLTWKNGRQLASSTVGSIVTTYNYDISGNRVYRAGGGFRHTYHVVDGTALGEKIVFVSNGTTHYMEYMRDENGEVYGFIYDGSTYFLEKNALGDVKYLLNGSGGVLAKYTYDEWGKVVSVTDANGNVITDKANIAHLNPFRYRNYYYDWETGFYYLNSRYYDPTTCRWISADNQISGVGEDIKGYNLFAYCFNNPVNMIDPSGNWPSWGQVFAAAATVAVAAVFVAAVVASAGAVGVAAGVAAASIGASSAMVSAAMTVGTIGTYVVAAGIGVCALSNAGEILTGTNVIRDGLMGGNQEAYDTVQTALIIAGGGATMIGQTNPGVTGNSAKPSQNAQTVHKVPTTGTPNTSFDKLYRGNADAFQRTYYDYRGNISFQVDFTCHNNPTLHSNPHLHIWGPGGHSEQINLWYLK